MVLPQCKHQPLVGMTGPPIALHILQDAPLKVCQTPAHVALHWQAKVKKQLDDDVTMGILEKVPHGEPSRCCHRMVVTRKANGEPLRTVDMSSLNQFTERETHHVRSPFEQARMIPAYTYKTVTDAWNGFHSVILRVEDRWLTTFITPWGRYRYKVAPQGSAASGDGYARRYDEIIENVERITKCVDDAVQWDTDLEQHWWRVIDYLELCANNGIVLNKEKFQFCAGEVDFAGFRVTNTSVKPLEKFLKAISDFPTPQKVVDIRAWFGLVQQVSHYSQLTEMMRPFKPFLSPGIKFEWNTELNTIFEKSKVAIIEAIKDGVRIFDPKRRSCLRTDYSKKGLGYFLSPKHCQCASSIPGCCEYGWKVTLSGSRFTKPAESRYAPIEGEALAIAWALKQTRYFTQGCDNLVVVTDHKPLVGTFRDTMLEGMSNSRLFKLKEKTLPWKFTVVHAPGKENKFADAASRFPSPSACTDDTDDCDSVTLSEVLAGIMTEVDDDTDDDGHLAALSEANDVRAVTWEMVSDETEKDTQMQNLLLLIESTFPDDKADMPQQLMEFWPLRHNLYVVDGVILLKDHVLVPRSLRNMVIDSHSEGNNVRILIPPTLRQEIVHTLHSAHQGTTGMNECAKVSVYWPGITNDIKNARSGCSSCNQTTPSQAKLPPILPIIPTTPFEAIACDYFKHIGHYYFVAADRLSGWIELQQIKVGTNEAGAQGLCKAVRRLMVTFGVPSELSSDGGPEFKSDETKAFFRRWGINHRLSSSYLPSSNGRAELAVKTAKRLLMENINASGKLDNDAIVRALLTYRNTPDPGCKLSPAQILMGRQLRDTLPYLSKEVMCYNNPQVSRSWREAWATKEDALRTRYVKTLENLSEHSRPLPPLRHGDPVMLQNQHGQYPKKWDRSGVVVETKDNDQYVVKVAGSGRLTLRNRRFLRKYEAHQLHHDTSAPKSVALIPLPAATSTRESYPVAPPQSVTREQATSVPSPPSNSATLWVSMSPRIAQPTAMVPSRLSFGNFPEGTPSTTSTSTPTTSSSPVQEETQHQSYSPAVEQSNTPAVRGGRQRKQREVYDAATGSFHKPVAVPDNL